jgi:hypothetical protein
MDLASIEVAKIAKEFGYKTEFTHDGEKYTFKLTSDDKDKKPFEFSLDDKTANVIKFEQLREAINKRIDSLDKTETKAAEPKIEQKAEDVQTVTHTKHK